MAAADIVKGNSSGASGGAITGTFITVTSPGGGATPVAGDKLVLKINTRDAMTGWRVPAGWTSTAVTSDETSGEGFFYHATYGDGTGGTVTGTSWTFDNGAGNVTVTKWSWGLTVLNGTMVGSLLTSAAQGRATSGTSTPTPAISPAESSYLVAAAGDRISVGSTWSWPTGWVEQVDILNEPSGGTNLVSTTLAVYDTTPAVAGTYSVVPVASTTGGVGWAGIWAFAVVAPAGPVIPTANFVATPVTGTAPLTVQFSDTSSGIPTSWSWNFGDSTTSTLQNPSKSYSNPGTYTVTLTATNAQGSDGETKTGYIIVTAPGALPGLIDGIEPEAVGHVPPFLDGNGNLYRLTEEYLAQGNNPMMMKSTDGGSTWVQVDAAGAPSGSTVNDLESGWMFQSGTVLAFLWTDDTSLFYCTFNTSDAPVNQDKWVIAAEVAVAGLTAGSQAQASMVQLSDGRVRAFFSDSLSGSNHQIAMATKSTTTAAGGWSAKTLLTSSTADLTGMVGVRGASDLVHLFYHNYATKQIVYTNVNSADTFGTAVRADTSGTSTLTRNYNAVSNPVYYESGGNTVVAALYGAQTSIRLVSLVNGVVQAEQVVDTNAVLISPEGSEGNTANDGPVFHLALDGTTIYAIWTEASTGDVYWSKRDHGGSWTARQILWDAPVGRAAHWVYNNIYTRGGTKLMGYTYDDGPHLDNDSNIYYNAMPIVSATNLNKVRLGIDIPKMMVGDQTVTKIYMGDVQTYP